MARKNVITATMFKYRRGAPKSPFVGWGYIATRKARTMATSPHLLSYRGCIAGKLIRPEGSPRLTLEEVQKMFREHAHRCRELVEHIKPVPKKAKAD
jgi:hypothetical protein